jgi:hypothetical protein
MKNRILLAGLLMLGLAPTVRAPTVNAAPLDGTKYAVIAPTFYTASGAGTQSYIRLFSGAGTLGTKSTFNVTLVGATTGNAYGSPFTLNIPYMASVQYSLGQLVALAGAGAFTGGDTAFAVWLRNTDLEAGYQHVTYNPVSLLFENISNCISPIGERMLPLHSQAILTNVHTSKVAGNGYPSTIHIYNYSQAPVSYTFNVFNGGNVASGATVAPNSGKLTCQYRPSGSVAANGAAIIPMSTIEAASGCTLDSDEFYANIQVVNENGPMNAVVTHLIRASAYNGDSNLTDVCAVNKASLASTAFAFISGGSQAATYALTAPQGLQAVTITGFSQGPTGNAIATGTFQTSPVASVLATSTGFNFTAPDGKVFNFNTTVGAQTFSGPGYYQGGSTDGTGHMEISLTNRRVSTLNFATFGFWAESDASGDVPQAIGTLTAGLPTAAVPATGSLFYTGSYTGAVATATNTALISGGTVNLTFNFATKTVTGSITDVAVSGVESTTFSGMSDIGLSGTITGNTFTGTATPGATVAGALVSLGSVAGTFTGTINGPAALDVVANLPFSGAGLIAVTAFGAHAN